MSSKLIAALSFGTLLTAGPAGAVDLLEVYQLAQKNDPAIREAEANYLAAKQAKPQAWARYLPQIIASGARTEDDETGTRSFFTLDPLTGQPRFQEVPLDAQPESTYYQVGLRQALFNWSYIRQIGQAAAEVARAEAQYQAAQQDLLLRTAERYFNLLAAQDALESARANREAIGRQLEQARKRFEVGLIAITDVQESQAAYDQAVADEIAAERSLASAREAVRELTGSYFETLERPLDSLPLSPPDPDSPEAWVELALKQNLNLLASRFNAEAADAAVGSARGAHYPTLDLVASHSKFEQETAQTLAGVSAPSTIDTETDSISLQLNVPIFSGGATQARVREARYRYIAAREQLERVTRETERQARDAFLGVVTEISRVQALRQALASSETALKATEAGFEVGTRTTVDVLDARRNLFRAQTNYARSKYDYLLNSMRLRATAGLLTAADLERINAWLE
ncbi:MAG TPA: TolC family outer membrane protein [Gammaproteobacteria bacterium]|nr:TolC family outer membrane protein [Gammaproteobacteria bacterium]